MYEYETDQSSDVGQNSEVDMNTLPMIAMQLLSTEAMLQHMPDNPQKAAIQEGYRHYCEQVDQAAQQFISAIQTSLTPDAQLIKAMLSQQNGLSQLQSMMMTLSAADPFAAGQPAAYPHPASDMQYNSQHNSQSGPEAYAQQPMQDYAAQPAPDMQQAYHSQEQHHAYTQEAAAASIAEASHNGQYEPSSPAQETVAEYEQTAPYAPDSSSMESADVAPHGEHQSNESLGETEQYAPQGAYGSLEQEEASERTQF